MQKEVYYVTLGIYLHSVREKVFQPNCKILHIEPDENNILQITTNTSLENADVPKIDIKYSFNGLNAYAINMSVEDIFRTIFNKYRSNMNKRLAGIYRHIELSATYPSRIQRYTKELCALKDELAIFDNAVKKFFENPIDFFA